MALKEFMAVPAPKIPPNSTSTPSMTDTDLPLPSIVVENETHAQATRQTKDGRTIIYQINVIQEPDRARACGQGAKSSTDRRPVDPPPIIDLHIFERDPQGTETDVTSSYRANFFMWASLENARPIAQGRNAQSKDAQTPQLCGAPVSGISYLDRPNHAGYFIFPDLSVRQEGRYRLAFTLYEELREIAMLDRDLIIEPDDKPLETIFARAVVRSIPFIVWSAKKFPGLSESTHLSSQVAEQGCRVRIRREIRMRKRNDKGSTPKIDSCNNDDEDEDEEEVARRVPLPPSPEQKCSFPQKSASNEKPPLSASEPSSYYQDQATSQQHVAPDASSHFQIYAAPHHDPSQHANSKDANQYPGCAPPPPQYHQQAGTHDGAMEEERLRHMQHHSFQQQQQPQVQPPAQYQTQTQTRNFPQPEQRQPGSAQFQPPQRHMYPPVTLQQQSSQMAQAQVHHTQNETHHMRNPSQQHVHQMQQQQPHHYQPPPQYMQHQPPMGQPPFQYGGFHGMPCYQFPPPYGYVYQPPHVQQQQQHEVLQMPGHVFSPMPPMHMRQESVNCASSPSEYQGQAQFGIHSHPVAPQVPLDDGKRRSTSIHTQPKDNSHNGAAPPMQTQQQQQQHSACMSTFDSSAPITSAATAPTQHNPQFPPFQPTDSPSTIFHPPPQYISSAPAKSKRTYASSFNTAHMDQRLRAGARPNSSTSRSGAGGVAAYGGSGGLATMMMLDGGSGDEDEAEPVVMEYKRADGSVVSRRF